MLSKVLETTIRERDLCTVLPTNVVHTPTDRREKNQASQPIHVCEHLLLSHFEPMQSISSVLLPSLNYEPFYSIKVFALWSFHGFHVARWLRFCFLVFALPHIDRVCVSVCVCMWRFSGYETNVILFLFVSACVNKCNLKGLGFFQIQIFVQRIWDNGERDREQRVCLWWKVLDPLGKCTRKICVSLIFLPRIAHKTLFFFSAFDSVALNIAWPCLRETN